MNTKSQCASVVLAIICVACGAKKPEFVPGTYVHENKTGSDPIAVAVHTEWRFAPDGAVERFDRISTLLNGEEQPGTPKVENTERGTYRIDGNMILTDIRGSENKPANMIILSHSKLKFEGGAVLKRTREGK